MTGKLVQKPAAMKKLSWGGAQEGMAGKIADADVSMLSMMVAVAAGM